MLETLLGGKNIEKILFYLLKNEKCYGQQLSKSFGQALSPFQKLLDRLENGGIIVSFLEGKALIYQFNPRYPFLKELISLLQKAYTCLPQDQKDKYYEPKNKKKTAKKRKTSMKNSIDFDRISAEELAVLVSEKLKEHKYR